MKEINTNNGFEAVSSTVRKKNMIMARWLAFIMFISVFGLGCKKDSTGTDRDYGYAKVVVACANKCRVSFGESGKISEYDVSADTANYYIRYQRNFNLDINITPTDADQSVTLSVYSREEKQIFRNKAVRKLNETWNSKILIP